MAILQGSSLTNCLYIPDFIASGTVMVFESTSAPTSWTKSTAHNDKSLRIVNGTISTGGSSSFSTVLSPSRSLSSPGTSAVQTGYQFAPSPTNATISTVTPPTVTVGSVAAVFGPHTHTYQFNPNVNRTNSAPQVARSVIATADRGTGFTGGGGQHNHTITGSPHTHPVTSDIHTHTITESPHSHPAGFTAQSFAVYYRDVILATKD
jgi:hypothetical protein